MMYTDKDIIADINKVKEMIDRCDYLNAFSAKSSQARVVKAYNMLFEIEKKIKARNK